MKSTLKNFRANVLYASEAAGISQRELARRSGVHFVTVNRIVRGVQDPGVQQCERIAAGLGIPLRDLIIEPTRFSEMFLTDIIVADNI